MDLELGTEFDEDDDYDPITTFSVIPTELVVDESISVYETPAMRITEVTDADRVDPSRTDPLSPERVEARLRLEARASRMTARRA